MAKRAKRSGEPPEVRYDENEVARAPVLTSTHGVRGLKRTT